jgi:transaldolase
VLDRNSLRIKIFADGADRKSMRELAQDPLIQGFTTNPTLMRQAGVDQYEQFAAEVLSAIPDRPISFEVFSDDFAEMDRQARKIASWGNNVYVKIPVTSTQGEISAKAVRGLAEDGVKLNVTAIMTLEQVRTMAENLEGTTASIISVFAGRIADSGRDPVPIMQAALELVRPYRNIELLWASPREVLNIVQADSIGCHIITVTHELLRKLPLIGKSLEEFSLDTVKMFHSDAASAGYAL